MDRFQTFFNETKVRFFNFLVRLSGDADRAADVFQESYLRYWQRYGKQPSNPGLLFTIGRNLAVDGHRRQKPHQPFEDLETDQQADQETALIIKEEYQRVLAAMQRLEPVEREVLSLAVSGDFPYERIAQITRLSQANVKVKIHRAREKLRRYLKEA